MVVGLVLKSQQPERPAGMSGVAGVSGAQSLTSGGATAIPAEEEGLSTWSPFFVKGGFSFLIAFCVGWALRAFFKVSALVVGVIAIGVFALQKSGFVDVDWQAMSQHWDTFAGKLREHGEGLKDFMTGNLPSAGLAALGLVTGFTRG
ncbi:MAG: FUN14 domain-containing protein [Planctomycetota bacterium]